MPKIGTLFYDINGNDNLKKILEEDKKRALELQRVLKETNAIMGKIDLRQLKQYSSIIAKSQIDSARLASINRKSDDESIIRQQRLKTEIERTNAAHQRYINATVSGHKKINSSIGLTNKTLFSQQNLMTQLSQAAGIYFSVYQVGSFIRSLYTVSGEFEKQKVSLGAILQSTEQAGVLYERIKGLAVKSPFQFSELISYTKQLSAFSVPYNELFDTTKRLADISAGLGVDMNRLVLAFGQVRSASVLRGQELRQFTEAGIPLVDELAKKFTKLTGEATSAGDVFDKISRRQVSFQMVKDIFTELTSEGGKFYKFQEIQAESLAGKLSNLKDSYQIMLSQIGEGNSGVMKDSVELLTSMMSNWESIARILKTLVVTYGTYRAVLITINALQKANVALTGAQRVLDLVNLVRASKGLTAATYSQVSAQRALNFVMSINPYVAIASVIAGLVGAMVLFSEKTKTTADIQTEFNQKLADEQQQIEQTTSSAKGYVKTATDLSASYSSRKKALDELQKLMPEVFKNMSLEKLAALGLADAYNLVNKAVSGMTLGTARTDYYQATKEVLKAERELAEAESKTTGVKGSREAFQRLELAREAQRLAKKQYQDLLVTQKTQENIVKTTEQWRDAIEQVRKANPTITDIAAMDDEGYSEYINRIQGDYENLITANKNLVESNPFAKKEIDANKARIEAYRKVLSAVGGAIPQSGGSGEDPIYNRVKQQIDIIDKAKSSYEEFLKVASGSEAARLVKEKTGIDFSTKSAEEQLKALDLSGMLSKNILATQNRIAELTIKYDKKSTVDSFKDATDAVIRYVEDNKERFNVFQKILSESGNEVLAKNLAFGTTPVEFENYASLIKDQISKALRLVGDKDNKSVEDLLGLDSKTFESQPDNIKKLVELYKSAQEDVLSKSSETTYELIKSHQSMQNAINAAQIKANADYEAIELQRKNIGDKVADETIAQRKKDLATEIANIKFNELKKTSLWKKTFEDLKYLSKEELSEIISGIEESTSSIGGTMDVSNFKELIGNLTSLKEALIEKDPFKALADSARNLSIAETELKNAERNLQGVRSGKIEMSVLSEADAVEALNRAREKHNEENKNFIKAQASAIEKVNELSSALKSVGDTIGGSVGQMISFLGDIGNFVTVTVDGIQKVSATGVTALTAIEKASVILTIISTAIQLLQKLDSILPNAYNQYEKYAAKIAEINKLTDAVNDYRLAVLEANNAENNWFSEDSLRNLQDYKELQEATWDSYLKKLKEQQAIYQNQSGGGWITNPWNSLLGVYDSIYGTSIFGRDYEKGTTAAINNLRIETRKRSKGFLGSGIGGKSQKTEDLQTWINNNKDKFAGLDTDLFDENLKLNTKLANVILENYGDKLVGQTKETLESLAKLQEQYDEYLEQLQEYVSSLYEPLVTSMVDSLWDWFDEGKNALDSFKDYAGDTFRDIASDMLRTLIMKNVFGDYQDDIAKLYEDYSISEGTASDLTKLNEGVTKYTQDLMDRYADQLPALQSMITQIGASMEGIGINLKDTESSKSGIVANVQSLTEDTGNRLYGVVNGSYGHLSAIRAMYEGNSQSVMSNIYNIMEAYYPNVVNQIAIGNAELIKINNNTLRSANNSDGILSAVEELRTTVKRVTTSGSGTKINT
jgi:hypothetical protein